MSDIQVEFDTAEIPGDSAVAGYEDAIACTGMQHGVDLQVVSAAATRIEGASVHGSITLQHRVDRATPKLRKAAVQGTSQGKVTITRTRTAGEIVEAIETITLSDVEVGAIYLVTPLKGDASGPLDQPIEVFTLDYGEIRWKHGASNAEGTWSTQTATTSVQVV